MILLGVNVSSILITCRNKQLAMRNYVPAIHVAGWHKPIQLVSPDDPTPSLDGVAGLLLSGGGVWLTLAAPTISEAAIQPACPNFSPSPNAGKKCSVTG